MAAKLSIIWDYDTAIGQVNATYPYKFDETRLLDEIANTDTILQLGDELKIAMTFACVGFAAEAGHFPYHIPDQIKQIYQQGHEIASHSWRHEWLPYLEKEQLRRTLQRSKETLEACIGVAGAVQGFVPPFNRPMSWYSRGALSLGDRVIGPWYPGASIGSLLRFLHEAGYAWCRIVYRPLWKKFIGGRTNASILNSERIACVPQHYVGFDAPAQRLLKQIVENGSSLFVCGHPSGLSRDKNENVEHLRAFLRQAASHRDRGELEIRTVREHICENKGAANNR